MREIKFRAWDKKLKMMTHFSEWHLNREYNLLAFSAKEADERNWSYGDMPHEQENCELMQFTGLKDKNGKPIFEGDIIGSYTRVKRFVLWIDEWARFGTKKVSNQKYAEVLTESQAKHFEIIGNIYENPDLTA